MEEDDIRALVARLARPDRATGGHTVERAAIMAAGVDGKAVLAWLEEHAATPEALAPKRVGGGLHGDRAGGADRTVRRFVLPPGTLD